MHYFSSWSYQQKATNLLSKRSDLQIGEYEKIEQTIKECISLMEQLDRELQSYTFNKQRTIFQSYSLGRLINLLCYSPVAAIYKYVSIFNRIKNVAEAFQKETWTDYQKSQLNQEIWNLKSEQTSIINYLNQARSIDRTYTTNADKIKQLVSELEREYNSLDRIESELQSLGFSDAMSGGMRKSYLESQISSINNNIRRMENDISYLEQVYSFIIKP